MGLGVDDVSTGMILAPALQSVGAFFDILWQQFILEGIPFLPWEVADALNDSLY